MTPLEKELSLPHSYTKYEVIAELERELGMRRKLYTSWIATGRIRLCDAADRIRLLEMALADLQETYREQALAPLHQIDLFPLTPQPTSQFRDY
jgi:hypothetical protein